MDWATPTARHENIYVEGLGASYIRELTVCWIQKDHVESLVQDCITSIVLAMELLQSCTKPSML